MKMRASKKKQATRKHQLSQTGLHNTLPFTNHAVHRGGGSLRQTAWQQKHYGGPVHQTECTALLS